MNQKNFNFNFKYLQVWAEETFTEQKWTECNQQLRIIQLHLTIWLTLEKKSQDIVGHLHNKGFLRLLTFVCGFACRLAFLSWVVVGIPPKFALK